MFYQANTLPNYPGCPQTDEANLYTFEMMIVGLLVEWDFDNHQPKGTAASRVCQRNFTAKAEEAMKTTPIKPKASVTDTNSM